MHAKVFSIQIFQYLRQIPPRVCTLVLFIISSGCSVIREVSSSSMAHMQLYFVCACIIESVDSINRDERGFPLTQYITNWGISRAR